MFNPFMQEGGEVHVYIPVEADDSMSMPMMMNAGGTGGAGVVGAPFIIKWAFNGGITGKTWVVNGIEIPHAVYNQEAINSAITDALPTNFVALYEELGRLGVGTCVVNG